MKTKIHTTTTFSLLAVVALSGVATGQATTKVIPVSATTTEGSSSSAFPFAYTTGRTQQIWRGTALTQAVGLLTGVSYRRDGSGAAFPKVDYTSLNVSIGQTTVTPQAMSTTFSNNRTSPLTAILRSAKYSLPAIPAPTTPPASFNIHLNWTTSFVFDARKGNVILEWNMPGSPAKNSYFVDAESFKPGNATGTVVPFGTFGKFSAQENATFSAVATTLKPGGTLDVNGNSFSKSYTARLIFGLSNKTYNSIPLPYDLTAIGAPGNSLYTSMDLLLPFPMSAQGSQWNARFTAPIPNDKMLSGLTFYAQSYYGDANANAAGLVASNALALTTPAANPQPETNQVGYYDSTQPTGWLAFGANAQGGPVVRFTGVLP
jgi:hypothetical protein